MVLVIWLIHAPHICFCVVVVFLIRWFSDFLILLFLPHGMCECCWFFFIFSFCEILNVVLLIYSIRFFFLSDSNSGWNQRTAKIVLPFYFCCNGKKQVFIQQLIYELWLLHSSIDAQAVTARQPIYVFFRLICILIFLTKNTAKFYWWNGTHFKLMNSYKCICYWIKYRKWAIRCIA